jgi:hypothetical protein
MSLINVDSKKIERKINTQDDILDNLNRLFINNLKEKRSCFDFQSMKHNECVMIDLFSRILALLEYGTNDQRASQAATSSIDYYCVYVCAYIRKKNEKKNDEGW